MAVGWYLRFSLSYRDVEELLAERGLHADHVTVWRWVRRYAPEMERRLRSRLKSTNDRACLSGQASKVATLPYCVYVCMFDLFIIIYELTCLAVDSQSGSMPLSLARGKALKFCGIVHSKHHLILLTRHRTDSAAPSQLRQSLRTNPAVLNALRVAPPGVAVHAAQDGIADVSA